MMAVLPTLIMIMDFMGTFLCQNSPSGILYTHAGFCMSGISPKPCLKNTIQKRNGQEEHLNKKRPCSHLYLQRILMTLTKISGIPICHPTVKKNNHHQSSFSLLLSGTQKCNPPLARSCPDGPLCLRQDSN